MTLLKKKALIEYLIERDLYEVIGDIERGIFDYEGDEDMVEKYIGETLMNSYCNGFFGRTYDLYGAEILSIEESRDKDAKGIKVVVRKVNDTLDEALFTDSWGTWDTVAEHLEKWTNGL